uniref:Uncharacterized protein n=1 Tax=Erpetoichthys calabaricus TaxID=27687 RepID=A0A8C4RZN4_ERPCA
MDHYVKMMEFMKTFAGKDAKLEECVLLSVVIGISRKQENNHRKHKQEMIYENRQIDKTQLRYARCTGQEPYCRQKMELSHGASW